MSLSTLTKSEPNGSERFPCLFGWRCACNNSEYIYIYMCVLMLDFITVHSTAATLFLDIMQQYSICLRIHKYNRISPWMIAMYQNFKVMAEINSYNFIF